VASVGLVIGYDVGRSERLELRGTALVNANDFDGGLRTTGFISIVPRGSARVENTVAYNPGALDRNLVFTLAAEETDLALLRELFVGQAGSRAGAANAVLTLWAKTARPFSRDGAADQRATGFGYRLDFPLSPGPR
jgi:hypothetical protein